MRRLIVGAAALALFAGFAASAPAEARGSRGGGVRGGGGGLHSAHFAGSGGGRRALFAGAWRGGVHRGASHGYGARGYAGYDQAYGWGGYDDGAWSGPAAAGYVDVALGGYCATPARTCALYSPAQLGADCSCRVPGGHAHGAVE